MSEDKKIKITVYIPKELEEFVINYSEKNMRELSNTYNFALKLFKEKLDNESVESDE